LKEKKRTAKTPRREEKKEILNRQVIFSLRIFAAVRRIFLIYLLLTAEN